MPPSAVSSLFAGGCSPQPYPGTGVPTSAWPSKPTYLWVRLLVQQRCVCVHGHQQVKRLSVRVYHGLSCTGRSSMWLFSTGSMFPHGCWSWEQNSKPCCSLEPGLRQTLRSRSRNALQERCILGHWGRRSRPVSNNRNPVCFVWNVLFIVAIITSYSLIAILTQL